MTSITEFSPARRAFFIAGIVDLASAVVLVIFGLVEFSRPVIGANIGAGIALGAASFFGIVGLGLAAAARAGAVVPHPRNTEHRGFRSAGKLAIVSLGGIVVGWLLFVAMAFLEPADVTGGLLTVLMVPIGAVGLLGVGLGSIGLVSAGVIAIVLTINRARGGSVGSIN